MMFYQSKLLLFEMIFSTKLTPWKRVLLEEPRNSLRLVQCRGQKSPPLVPTVSQTDPAHTLISYFFGINFNIIRPSTHPSPKWYIRFRFSDYNFLWISYILMRATWPAYIIIFNFIILMRFGENTNYEAPHHIFSNPVTSSEVHIILFYIVLTFLNKRQEDKDRHSLFLSSDSERGADLRLLHYYLSVHCLVYQ